MKREFSLSSKLATLDVGQAIYFDDSKPAAIATNMERQITNLVAKSPKLSGRRFTTTRGDVITVNRAHYPVLKVARVS